VLFCLPGIQPHPANAPVKKLPSIYLVTADDMGPSWNVSSSPTR